MNNIAAKDTLTLDELIKVVEQDVHEKKQAFEIAQSRLKQAREELFQLRTSRDAFHIQNLNGQKDWDMVFNYTPNETNVATEYRESLLKEYELIQTGNFNCATQQYCFAIKFESDMEDERLLLKSKVEFIFKNLKVNPETGMKSISLENIRDDSWSDWTLEFNPVEQKYSVIKKQYGIDTEMFAFTCLEEILKKIQSISDFESED
ncbi:hypothetical protein MMD27_000291 [Acinetobacter baumannii]|nr:hypothetical protein [Acinetobacter baumannii]